MYRCILIIWILLGSVEFAMAQNNGIDGVYYGRFGDVQISGNRFNYFESDDWGIKNNDTLARCTLKWIDDEFVVLNSSDYYDNCNNLEKSIRVTQIYDSTVAEGLIKIVFSYPRHYFTDFDIHTYDTSHSYLEINATALTEVQSPSGDANHSYYGIISSANLLPYDFERFSFVMHVKILENQEVIRAPRIYSSPVYPVSRACNSIEIRIGEKEYFRYFESYYVKEQYARIHNDTIYWNGNIYRTQRSTQLKNKNIRQTMAAAPARDSVCGLYYNDMNRACRISITKDKFYYMESLPIWTNDTLADFEWTRVGDQFIEVKYPYILWNWKQIMERVKIVQTYDSHMKTRGIKFKIAMPETDNLAVTVNGNYEDSSTERNSATIIYPETKELILPKRPNSFNFFVQPEKQPSFHDSIGVHYGVDGFCFLETKLDSNANTVEVSLPLTYSYFEQYYTAGEFVRVHKDTLTWKGRTFVKSE